MKKLTIISYGFLKAFALLLGIKILIDGTNEWEILIGFSILVLREIFIEWINTLPIEAHNN